VGVERFNRQRNAIAHIWKSDDRPSFSEVVDEMTLEYATDLGVIASHLMAAGIRRELRDVSDTKVNQWLNQSTSEVENLLSPGW
jgi:hypothetical protein